MRKSYKVTLFILITVIVVLIAGYSLGHVPQSDVLLSKGYKDATYIIDGKNVTLTSGISETPFEEGSATKMVTRYFGNEVKADFDGDGREDVAFVLTSQSSGSGLFYYFVAALNKKDGYLGSNAYFLGDRIAPQSTSLADTHTNSGRYVPPVVVVNFTTRKLSEPMVAVPSEDVSVKLAFDHDLVGFVKAPAK